MTELRNERIALCYYIPFFMGFRLMYPISTFALKIGKKHTVHTTIISVK